MVDRDVSVSVGVMKDDVGLLSNIASSIFRGNFLHCMQH